MSWKSCGYEIGLAGWELRLRGTRCVPGLGLDLDYVVVVGWCRLVRVREEEGCLEVWRRRRRQRRLADYRGRFGRRNGFW